MSNDRCIAGENLVINADHKCGSQAIWTLGHSTRAIGEFIEILILNQIESLVDVRQFPGSRKYPQFNKETLSESVHAIGIDYLHVAKLGGRRKVKPDSRNLAWRNSSFRAYADYMETHDFLNGIRVLVEVSSQKRTAFMCSEAVWWRCHRGLISDYLKSRGCEVIHILSKTRTEEHPYTSAARIVGGVLSYGLDNGEPNLFANQA